MCSVYSLLCGQFLYNPGEAREKTGRAHDYILKNLTLEKGVKKYEELYTEAIKAA